MESRSIIFLNHFFALVQCVLPHTTATPRYYAEFRVFLQNYEAFSHYQQMKYDKSLCIKLRFLLISRIFGQNQGILVTVQPPSQAFLLASACYCSLYCLAGAQRNLTLSEVEFVLYTNFQFQNNFLQLHRITALHVKVFHKKLFMVFPMHIFAVQRHNKRQHDIFNSTNFPIYTKPKTVDVSK